MLRSRSFRLLVGAVLLLAACAPAAQSTATVAPKAAATSAASPAAAATGSPAAQAAASPAATPAAQASPAANTSPAAQASPAAPATTAPAAKGPVTVGGFPSKTLRIMAPAAPGGGWDQTSRAVQQVLQDERIAAQPIEVINRPGAGGTVGLAELINQNRGDGHAVMTMGLVMVGAIQTNKSPVNLDSTSPLARLTTEYEAIAVGKDSKYQTPQQLMDDFKKDPKSVKWGGGSAGGTDHILVGLMAQAGGVDPKSINYVAFSGGGELRPQVIGNQVTVGVSGFAEFKADADAGMLRILAVSGPSRIPGSNVPTMKEAGVNVEITNWRGMVGPPGMKDNEKQVWIAMLTQMHDSKSWQDNLKKQDWTDAFLTGDQFASFLEEEDQRVTKVLRDIGLVQ
jgi:putative tricarboxylic transport membrane protein